MWVNKTSSISICPPTAAFTILIRDSEYRRFNAVATNPLEPCSTFKCLLQEVYRFFRHIKLAAAQSSKSTKVEVLARTYWKKTNATI
jgi:hypothetical protein